MDSPLAYVGFKFSKSNPTSSAAEDVIRFKIEKSCCPSGEKRVAEEQELGEVVKKKSSSDLEQNVEQSIEEVNIAEQSANDTGLSNNEDISAQCNSLGVL